MENLEIFLVIAAVFIMVAGWFLYSRRGQEKLDQAMDKADELSAPVEDFFDDLPDRTHQAIDLAAQRAKEELARLYGKDYKKE